MLIHLISDLARDRDDITERLADDVKAILDEYGISPAEREALQRRDIDAIARAVQDEARQIAQAFVEDDTAKGKGRLAEPGSQLDEWSWLYQWARQQAVTTALPLPAPAPWPGWPSVVPTARITPKTAVVQRDVIVTLELLDTDFSAERQFNWKFTLSFALGSVLQVAQTIDVADDCRSLTAKVNFTQAGVYNVMLTDPKGRRERLIPGGFLVRHR